MKFLAIAAILLCSTTSALAQNKTVYSFNRAKKTLERQVYYDHRETFYCGARFTKDKQVILPSGFHTAKHVKRAGRIEWEHVVPAENFGRAFKEWRDGDPRCVTNKGNAFKGRRCAEKVNKEYRYMQSDMHNLYPAIGAVNATRSNFNFVMLPSGKSDFGTCKMIVDNRKVQPPEAVMGIIARTYKYMDAAYPRYSMSSSQRKLMDAWDKMYPVSEWECVREERIRKLQGNGNSFVSDYCE